jgi:hypothetical protein
VPTVEKSLSHSKPTARGINEMVRRREITTRQFISRRIIAMQIASIGIDLGKTNFHLVAL